MRNIEVTSARELTPAQKSRIEEVFSKKLDSQVTAVYSVRSEILGGIIVVAGDDVYDGSLLTELQKIRHILEHKTV